MGAIPEDLSGSMEYPAFYLLILPDLTLADRKDTRRLISKAMANGCEKILQHVIFTAILVNGVVLHRQFNAAIENLVRDNECHSTSHCLPHTKKFTSRDQDPTLVAATTFHWGSAHLAVGKGHAFGSRDIS